MRAKTLKGKQFNMKTKLKACLNQKISCLIATVAILMSVAANAVIVIDPYIESSGVSGISTGYHLKPTTRLEVDFELTEQEQTNQAHILSTVRCMRVLLPWASWTIRIMEESMVSPPTGSTKRA